MKLDCTSTWNESIDGVIIVIIIIIIIIDVVDVFASAAAATANSIGLACDGICRD